MLEVTRKDNKESLENMVRRFNRKVQQSGVLAEARSKTHFEKSISKVERRKKAIVRKARRDEKMMRIKLGKR